MLEREEARQQAAQTTRMTGTFEIRSPAFDAGGPIPPRFTYDDDDHSPPLEWKNPPPGTRAFALIVDDPDAPFGDWVHWLIYDIPAECMGLPEGVARRSVVAGIGMQGTNDYGSIGYEGPCPRRGLEHHYHFRLFALDRPLHAPPRYRRGALLKALRHHVLAEADLTATYRRP